MKQLNLQLLGEQINSVISTKEERSRLFSLEKKKGFIFLSCVGVKKQLFIWCQMRDKELFSLLIYES